MFSDGQSRRGLTKPANPFNTSPYGELSEPTAVEAAQKRLAAVETWLGDRDYLEDRFTAADLMMTTVLRIVRHTDLVSERPALKGYQERCEARPAFKKAMTDHLRPFEADAR